MNWGHHNNLWLNPQPSDNSYPDISTFKGGQGGHNKSQSYLMEYYLLPSESYRWLASRTLPLSDKRSKIGRLWQSEA